MMKEFTSKNNFFAIKFENFFGSGWSNDLEQIIKKVVKPISLTKKIIESGWTSGEIDFVVEKNRVSFLFHIDDNGPNYMERKSNQTDNNKEQMRKWASAIGGEIEKLK
jgi:hypothetical protein